MGDWLQDRCNEIQKAQQEHIQKSLGTDIEKAQKANVGEIRTWDGKRYMKQPNGKWLQISKHGFTHKEHVVAAYFADKKGNKKEVDAHVFHANSVSSKEYTDKDFESDIEKGKSFPIGTIHNGYKKVEEGKWRKVSEHGKTKEEHEIDAKRELKNIDYYDKQAKFNLQKPHREMFKLHSEAASKLDDKEYSDEEVNKKK
jgi:hypothetical protein